MIDLGTNVLYAITVAIKGPVVIEVLLVMAWSVFELGRFLREWVGRSRNRRAWEDFLAHSSQILVGGEQGVADVLTRSFVPHLVWSCRSDDASDDPV